MPTSALRRRCEMQDLQGAAHRWVRVRVVAHVGHDPPPWFGVDDAHGAHRAGSPPSAGRGTIVMPTPAATKAMLAWWSPVRATKRGLMPAALHQARTSWPQDVSCGSSSIRRSSANSASATSASPPKRWSAGTSSTNGSSNSTWRRIPMARLGGSCGCSVVRLDVVRGARLAGVVVDVQREDHVGHLAGQHLGDVRDPRLAGGGERADRQAGGSPVAQVGDEAGEATEAVHHLVAAARPTCGRRRSARCRDRPSRTGSGRSRVAARRGAD